MLENGKISNRQLIILVILFTIGDSILVLPSAIAHEAKENAWISMLLGIGIGLIAVWIFTSVNRLNPQLTLVDANNQILGRVFGTVLSLLYVAYFLICASANVREIGDFMTTQTMPETPLQAIHIIFLLVVVMGIRLGLETFARAGEIFFPGFVVFFTLFIIFLLPQTHAENIQPVMAEGINPILRGSIQGSTFTIVELVIFLMIMPYVNQPNKVLRSCLIGAFIGGIAMFLLILMTILVIGADATANNIYPTYLLAKKISIGKFLERIEAILALMWFVTVFFKIVLFFYGFVLGISQIFKLKEYKVIVLPSALLLMVLSIIITPNITFYMDVISKYWLFFDTTFNVVFPLLLLCVYALRMKVFNNNGDKPRA